MAIDKSASTLSHTYFPALDGLRGVAVLLVVVSHVIAQSKFSVDLGEIGVTVFFVLSGYLITGVLLASHKDGYRHLGTFYAARAIRLLPALLVLIAASTAAWILQSRDLGSIAQYAATSLFYVENFFAAAHDQQVLAHTWSLAVEEQFYLLWPLLLPVLVARRSLTSWILISLLIALSVASRVYLALHGAGAIADTSLLTNAYSLVLGCLVRIIQLPPALLARRSGNLALCALLVLCGVAPALPLSAVSSPVVSAVVTAVLVAGALGGNRFLQLKPLRFLGQISYAWYLWHWPVLWFTGTIHYGWGGLLPAFCSLALAVISTYLLEQPIRRAYRARLELRERATPASPEVI